MTHYTVTYKNSPCPAFDAVQDVREWFGSRHDTVAEQIKEYTNPNVFALACEFAGIRGYPVRAWYEHFHGQGSWDKWFQDNPEAPTL